MTTLRLVNLLRAFRRQSGIHRPEERQPVRIAPSWPTVIRPAEGQRPATTAGIRPEGSDGTRAARAHGYIQIRPGTVARVAPPARAYWDERGWQRERSHAGVVYRGQYFVTSVRTRQKRHFPGRIEVTGRDVLAYLQSPPDEIARHPKWICFRHVRRDEYRLHWHRPAEHPDEAILYIEQILSEAINRP